MKTIGVVLLFGAVVLAGCMAGEEEPKEIALSHAESSEQTRATVDSVPHADLSYAALVIDVDGKKYAFGQFMDFDERRYQVAGKSDASMPVELGDVITVPAVGLVMVSFWWDGQKIASYEATIPDTRAPAAPMLVAPSAAAEGVSRLPTFRWSAANDPSGVSYSLEYSLDPNLAIALFTTAVDELSGTQYGVPAGKDLLGGQNYYWRVQAVDGAGNASPWSEIRSFVVTG